MTTEIKFEPRNFKISPTFDATKLLGAADTIENRIDVYVDQLHGWFIQWAQYLNDVRKDHPQHAGFAVLHLAMAYFEAHAVFLRGAKDKSATLFREGILAVFPQLEGHPQREVILDILWEDARCGLFHEVIARRRIILLDGQQAFTHGRSGGRDLVAICRHNLVNGILEHLLRYARRVRDPKERELRKKFERAWEIVHHGKDR